MKNHLIISLLILSVGFSQQEYNHNDLIKMDNGLYTVKFSDEPITGKVYGYFGEENNPKIVYIGDIRNGKREGRWKSYYHSTGKKIFDYNYKNGKLDVLNTYWYENGQKRGEGTYKDDKEDGLITSWYENGQKNFKGTYKDGKPDGLVTKWYENGQKEEEGTWKDGKEDGLFTEWYENGQKSFEGTYKDGKSDGLGIEWYENGQKKYEGTIKDDELISKNEWNEDGSVKE